MKRSQAKLVEQAKLHSGQVAIGEEGLGMFADQFEIEPVEQVVRTVSTAQAHHSARHHIRKGSIQIGQTLLRGSCKEEWAAFESVLAEPGRKAQRAQRLQATVNALGLGKGSRSNDADACAG